MKYNTEELYKWAEENEMKDKLVEALYFNSHGFTPIILQGELVKKENQYYYVADVGENFHVEEPIGNGSEEQNKILDKVKIHPEVMRVALVAYKDKYRLRVAFDEKEEVRKEQLNKTMVLDFLNLLEINTIGKMKALFEDSRNTKASRQALSLIGKGLKKRNEKNI